MKSRLLATEAPAATLLIRLMVGGVFLSEGLQKYLFPAEVGAGRFAKIGLPAPEFLGPFVGGVEIVCGTLVLLGLVTRLATLPLLVVMGVALTTTKVPILLASGFWKMAHESRTDVSMLLGALFLLWVGAGPQVVGCAAVEAARSLACLTQGWPRRVEHPRPARTR